MKFLRVNLFAALIFSAQANAQLPPSVKGECVIVPSLMFNVEPPPGTDEYFYKRFAVGSMMMEKDNINDLKIACRRLGVLASRDGIKTIRDKVGMILFVNGKIASLGGL